ncbi:MAG: 50S ribosomal protein L4 [Puniceicoccales bacterium]|jgi:large subunit ribosomal protein L4|nr:50S ribosomal protein L4 [Puniceicoccales bacterium]
MKLKVYSADGASFTEKDYAVPTFEGDKGVALLKQTVIAYQANLRQGTSKTKDYGEVAGSGKKILRQKGSGGSRHGDKRAPQLYKGGVVFGPRPRDWSKNITAKARKLALARALFDAASEGEVDVIEKFELDEAKTKKFDAILGRIRPEGKVLLVADSAWREAGSPAGNAALAARNIARLFITDATSLNAFDIVSFSQILISDAGLQQLLQRAA